MLQKLSIQNYALIEQLDIFPSNNLNIVTGETGAGKSIMLGAIGLLLGEKADAKVVTDPEKKCLVEATFNIEKYQLQSLFEEIDVDYWQECIVRREVAPGGRSRAFVNDMPVSLDNLKKITAFLIDIHSQHDTLLLGESKFQLQLIDAISGSGSILKEYQQQFVTYKALIKKKQALIDFQQKSNQENDFQTYLLAELQEANLISNEDLELELELKELENAGEIAIISQGVLDMISESDVAAIGSIKTAQLQLDKLSNISTKFQPLALQLKSIQIELKDAIATLEQLAREIEINPARIDIISERLSIIYKLYKKHGVKTIDELVTIGQKLEISTSSMAGLEDQILALNQEIDLIYPNIDVLVNTLSQKRKSVTDQLCLSIQELLSQLGMPHATMSIEIQPTDWTNTGIDKPILLFSSNKGIKQGDLKEVASGGEFSRLMFAIKYLLAEKIAMPTVIFDEVDTGISGEIALKMAKMMSKMAEKRQLITITHLPQIAAKGNTHFFVYKDTSSEKSRSKIKELTYDEKIFSLAQMIGGDSPSEIAKQSAKELLDA